MITWILIANAAKAKIFSASNLRRGDLKLLCELNHPDSRKKTGDLMSDKPGHYKAGGASRGVFIKNDPKEVEAEHFAIQLAHKLKADWNKNEYNQLVIVSPAHFYGLMKKHLDDNITDIVYIPKDYTRYPVAKLADSLKKHLFG